MWWRHQNYNSLDALAILLQYNREDVINLKAFKGEVIDFDLC